MFPQIQSYLRKSASRDRDTEQVGTFLATFTHDNANPYLNYAIPNDGAVPMPDEVEALIAAYRRHERKTRLEYIAELAPQVEPALLAQGFTVEGRLPLMIYTPDDAPTVRQVKGIELIAPQSDSEILDTLRAQHEAYGEPAPTEAIIPRWRKFLAAGGIMVFARDIATGAPAGGGVCDAPFGQTTELAGIGVREAYRRRGIAAAMTAWLAAQARAAGTTTVFLMAAGEAEARIYERVGFTDIGQVLHIAYI